MSAFIQSLIGTTEKEREVLQIQEKQAAADEVDVRRAASELKDDRSAMRASGQNVENALDVELTQAQEVLRSQLALADKQESTQRLAFEAEQDAAKTRDLAMASIQTAYGMEQERQVLGENLARNAALIQKSKDDLFTVQERMETSKNPLRRLIDGVWVLPRAEQELQDRQQQRINMVKTQGAVLRGAVQEQQVADFFTPQADDSDLRAAKYNLIGAVAEATTEQQKLAYMTKQAENYAKRYGLQSDLVSSGGGFLNSMIQMYSANASIRASKIASGAGDIYKKLKDHNALRQDGMDPISLENLENMGYSINQIQGLGPEGRLMVLRQAEIGLPFTAGTESFKSSEMGEVMQTLAVAKSAVTAGPDMVGGSLVTQIIDGALAEMQQFQRLTAQGDKDGLKTFLANSQFVRGKPGNDIIGGGDEVVGLDFTGAMDAKIQYYDITGQPLSNGPVSLAQAMVDSYSRPGSAQGRILLADPEVAKFEQSGRPGAKLMAQIRALAGSKMENGESVVPANRVFHFDDYVKMAEGNAEEVYGFYAQIQQLTQRRLPTAQLGAATIIPPAIAQGEFAIPGAFGIPRIQKTATAITSLEDVKKLMTQQKQGKAMSAIIEAQNAERASRGALNVLENPALPIRF